MIDTEATKNVYLHAFTRVASELAGDSVPWVHQIREQALARFAEQGFPTIRDEDWKYTNLAPILKHTFKPAEKGHSRITAQDLDKYLFQDLPCYRMVFIDGHYVPALSTLDPLPAGVTANSLAATIADQPAALEPYLGRYAPTDKHGFTALNTAFLVDGAYLHVSANTVVRNPIHVLFVATENSDSVLTQPRNLLVAQDNSQVTVIESYVAIGEARYLTNAVSEVVAGKGAVIEHYKLGQESLKAFHIGSLYVHQDVGSRFTSHNIALGGVLVRNNIQQLFDAEGGECGLNGLYLVTGRQHVDNHTRIDHAKPRCASREFYKGVLDGRARAVFNGRIVVHQDAQHTDAQQENKNLLLSRDAEVDTKPQLEIYADDVKCAHGATVGQLDQDAIYYLRTRGVDEETARDLLTYAFARDVLNRIELDPIRSYVEGMLTTRLLHGRRIEELT
ncbi:MAG: Fe-S cluster assembly protein SufD [Acidiferrobacterales bacterium]